MLRFARKFANMASNTPMEDAIRQKLMTALAPTTLEILNDSRKHSHHQAMEGVLSKETHFRLIITSAVFRSKPQLARHRVVNTLLRDELEREGGIHALQLKTLTPEEEERLAKAKAKAKAKETEGES